MGVLNSPLEPCRSELVGLPDCGVVGDWGEANTSFWWDFVVLRGCAFYFHLNKETNRKTDLWLCRKKTTTLIKALPQTLDTAQWFGRRNREMCIFYCTSPFDGKQNWRFAWCTLAFPRVGCERVCWGNLCFITQTRLGFWTACLSVELASTKERSNSKCQVDEFHSSETSQTVRRMWRSTNFYFILWL